MSVVDGSGYDRSRRARTESIGKSGVRGLGLIRPRGGGDARATSGTGSNGALRHTRHSGANGAIANS